MTFPKGFEHWDMVEGKFSHRCDICQRLFFSKRRTGVKFCGATCRKRASDGHKTFYTTINCKHCGRMGNTVQPFQHKQYCSNACRQAAYRLRKANKQQ